MNGIKINPCNCGGIPHIAQHYDKTYDEILYFVRCYKCYLTGKFTLSDDEAIELWNKENNYELKTTTRGTT
jgi:hypothetical protein